MWILNGLRTAIINTDHLDRLTIAEKSNACLIVARFAGSDQPVTLARYQDLSEALAALDGLHQAISEDWTSYRMDQSTGPCKPPERQRPQNGYHGRKHAGHGSS